MTHWIFIAVGVLLLGVTLRMWLEFGQRQRQLATELHRLRGLIETHTQRTETIRARTGELTEETERLVTRREELHAAVLSEREKLAQLEERLERVRPKSHQVDNNPKDDTKDDWI